MTAAWDLPERRMDHDALPPRLSDALAQSARLLARPGPAPRAAVMRRLIDGGLAAPPFPGSGETLRRWQALAAVAAHDLALVKLYEGHADALAILHEAGASVPTGLAWAMWAAESPGACVSYEPGDGDACTLTGVKAWCSGAHAADAALLTVWRSDGAGPFLASVRLDAPGVSIDDSHWQAVGMAASDSVDVRFQATPARLVGDARFYLDRPGFWHGGIGIAACWHGATCALAQALHAQAHAAGDNAGWHRTLALGGIDPRLAAQAALLREAAAWVDAQPRANARAWALRTRALADETAADVLRLATRAMGAGPLCRDATFARRAADLPVFVRQSHGDRDLQALGAHLAAEEATPWNL